MVGGVSISGGLCRSRASGIHRRVFGWMDLLSGGYSFLQSVTHEPGAQEGSWCLCSADKPTDLRSRSASGLSPSGSPCQVCLSRTEMINLPFFVFSFCSYMEWCPPTLVSSYPDLFQTTLRHTEVVAHCHPSVAQPDDSGA